MALLEDFAYHAERLETMRAERIDHYANHAQMAERDGEFRDAHDRYLKALNEIITKFSSPEDLKGK